MTSLTQNGGGRPCREEGTRRGLAASARRVCLVIALASAGLASHRDPGRIESCTAGVSLPNQPSGFSCASVVDFSSSVATTASPGPGADVTSTHVPTSPTADHDAFKVAISDGWGGDQSGFALEARPILPAPSRVVYFAVVLRVKGWQDPEGQADTQVRLELSAGGEVILGLMGGSDNGLTPAIRLTGIAEGYVTQSDPSLASFAPILSANRPDAPSVITENKWHTWEILVTLNSAGQTNGQLTWWIDGKASGAYDGLAFASADAMVTGLNLVTLARQPLKSDATEWLDEFYVATPGTAEAPDRVEIANNTVTDHLPEELPDPASETLTLLNAADDAGTCLRDIVVPQSPSFTNLLHRTTCGADEIVVISVDDAVTRDDGLGGVIWQAQPGEVRPETLGPLIEVPVIVWIAVPSIRETIGEVQKWVPTTEIVRRDLQFANVWFNLNRAGVRFVDTIHDVTGDDAAVTLIGSICNSQVPGSKAPTGGSPSVFVPGALNVYYVEQMGQGYRGYHCYFEPHVVDPNMIYVSASTRSPSTLAHELGHAFALQHVDSTLFNGFTPNNLMWDGDRDVERQWLTLGQVYQVNLEELSMLNQNHQRHDAQDCDSRQSLKDVLPSTEAVPHDGLRHPCPRLSLLR